MGRGFIEADVNPADLNNAYQETAYLMRSPKNRERLEQAIDEIRRGQFQRHALHL
jgi:PHD/YefM family antitoxin component YafN of YafNO toxin-antitoxin module